MNTSDHKQLVIQKSSILGILDAASIGIWRITMRQGHPPKMNGTDMMLKLIGLEKDHKLSDEELYEAWYSRVCPDEREAVNNYIEGMRTRDGQRNEVLYKWEHPTLGTRYVRCGGTSHEKKDGLRVFEGYHYDVTDEIAEQKQSSLVLHSLVNTYACLFYIDLEKNWYTSYLNTVLVEKYIPTSGDLRKARQTLIERLCDPSDKENVRKFTNLSTFNERLKYSNSISLQYRGVIFKWARVAFIVSDRNADGTVRHMVMTVKDITDQKERELKQVEELQQNIKANRAKTMMMQNMTHEIRTPLNAMFGFSQLLSMPNGCVTDEQKTEYFNYIYNSFNMLSMLIDDVMDIADAEHGNYRIKVSPFEVNKVCRNALQMVEMRLFADVKLRFTSDVADDYTIESDSRRVQQLLVNYLSNACKHTQKGEIHLHVSTSETPGRLTFSVTDTGEGIPEEKRKDIFKRYAKANDNVQGSGLGLHICSLIAEKLGGEIKLDESYTGGARFLFIL